MLTPSTAGAPEGCVDYDGCGPDTPVTFHGGQSGALQNANVLRDGRQRHVESRCELAYRAVTPGEPRQDLAAGRIGEGGKGRVEIRRLVNHMV